LPGDLKALFRKAVGGGPVRKIIKDSAERGEGGKRARKSQTVRGNWRKAGKGIRMKAPYGRRSDQGRKRGKLTAKGRKEEGGDTSRYITLHSRRLRGKVRAIGKGDGGRGASSKIGINTSKAC